MKVLQGQAKNVRIVSLFEVIFYIESKKVSCSISELGEDVENIVSEGDEIKLVGIIAKQGIFRSYAYKNSTRMVSGKCTTLDVYYKISLYCLFLAMGSLFLGGFMFFSGVHTLFSDEPFLWEYLLFGIALSCISVVCFLPVRWSFFEISCIRQAFRIYYSWFTE